VTRKSQVQRPNHYTSEPPLLCMKEQHQTVDNDDDDDDEINRPVEKSSVSAGDKSTAVDDVVTSLDTRHTAHSDTTQ